MAEYERLIIPVDILNGENSEKVLGGIVQRLEEIATVSNSVGYTTKEYSALSREFKDCAKNISIYSKLTQDINKANASSAMQQEKVAQAMQKTSQEAQRTAQALEKTKAMQNANALSIEKLNTQVAKTALIEQRAETAALRHAQALERQSQAAQQALRPYNLLNQQLREQAQKLQDAIASGTVNRESISKMAVEYNKLNGRLQATDKEFKELTKTQGESKNALERLKSSFNTFIALLAHTGFMKLTQMFRDFATSISKAGIELDALNNTMLAATGGWESGGREIEWVIDMSKRLGLSFRDVSDSYAKFMTSFTRSGGTISQSRQIFEDLSTAMVSLHLPAERMQGVFVALEQMANKGTVQAEELKRQLGNALPGAFELAAESMGILPNKLMEMMKKGEVFSKDFLPAFAATVKQALGQSIDIATVQFNASLGRLMTNLTLFKMNVGQILNEALLPLLNGLVSITGGLADLAKSFNQNKGAIIAFTAAMAGLSVAIIGMSFSPLIAGLNALGTTILTNTVVAIETLNIRLWALKGASFGSLFSSLIGTLKAFAALIWTEVLPAIGALITEAWALNISLGGIPLLIGAVAAGCVALTMSLQKAAKEAGNITPYIGFSQQMVTATKEVAALNSQLNNGQISQEDYTKKVEEFKKQFPELIGYIQKTGKDFQSLTQEEINNAIALGELDAKQRIATEKAKELDSWQATLSATFKVVWTNIKQFVSGAIDYIGSKFQWLINLWTMGKTAIKGFWSSVTDSTPFATLFGGTKFGHDVINQKIATATENERKKLEVVEKNLKAATAMFKTAQTSVAGLTTGGDSKGKTSEASKEAKTEWDNLTKLISKQEEEIKVLKLAGKENKNLEESYAKNIEKRKEIEAYVNKITAAGEGEVSMWKRLKKAADDANATYENRLSNSLQYTEAQIEEARQNAKSYNAIIKYAEAQKNANGILQITSRTAKQLTNDLVDGLFIPLKEGESIWSRFKDAGISAIKAIATEWVKNKANMILTGFQGGWAMGQQGGGTLGQKFIMGMLGAGQGAKGQTLLGTATNQTFGNNSYIASAYQGFLQKMGGFTNAANTVNNSAFNTMSSGALQLANTLNSATNPAVGAVTNAVMGVANPAVIAANGIAGMAVSAPIAATSMGALGATMTTASAGFTTAVPALTAMGAALAQIAASASTAATAMAAYAVAAAAASVASVPIVGAFLAPIAALATGAAIAAGTAMTGAAIGAGAMLAGGGQMLGGAMSGIGNKLSGISGLNKGANVVPHAKGGIVSSPTMFPMQGGNIGLAGEAGTEVIAPARRMSNGDVGIGAVQPQVIVNNYTNAAVEVKSRPDNTMEIKIAELNAMLSSSRTNKGMSNAQNRLQKNGRQIG